MKPATAKAKGTATETALVNYLRHWIPHVERRRPNGSHDRGDIAGTPGICWEVKSGARLDVAAWLHELAEEVRNDDARHGVIAVRPKGRPNPAEWFVILTLPDLMDLLVEAEWISSPQQDHGAQPLTGTGSQ